MAGKLSAMSPQFATGNREYFLNKPYSFGGSKKDSQTDIP